MSSATPFMHQVRRQARNELSLVLLTLVRHPREFFYICLAWGTPLILLNVLVTMRWPVILMLLLVGAMGALLLARKIGQALRTLAVDDLTPVWIVYVNGGGGKQWSASRAARLELAVWLDPTNHLGQVFQVVLGLVNWAVRAAYRLGSLAALLLLVALTVTPQTVTQAAASVAQAPAGSASPWLFTASALVLMVDFMLTYALSGSTAHSWTCVFSAAREDALRNILELPSPAAVAVVPAVGLPGGGNA